MTEETKPATTEEVVGVPLPEIMAILGKDVDTPEAAKKQIAHLQSMAGRLPTLEESHAIVQSLNAKLGNEATFDEGIKEIYTMFGKELETAANNGGNSTTTAVGDDDVITGAELKKIRAQDRKELLADFRKEMAGTLSPLLKKDRLAELAKTNPLFGNLEVQKKAGEIRRQMETGQYDPDRLEMAAAFAEMLLGDEVAEEVADSVAEALGDNLTRLKNRATSKASAATTTDLTTAPEKSAQQKVDDQWDRVNPRHALRKPAKKK